MIFAKKIRPSRNRAAVAPRSRLAKQAQLQKDVLRETALAALLIAGLFAASYFLDDWAKTRLQERDKLNGNVSQLTSEIAQLQQKMNRAEKALPMFQTLFKSTESPEIVLDRKFATEVVERLKEEYLFASLRVSMSGVKDHDNPKYKNAIAAASFVEMTLSIEALSDEHIMSFIKRLRQELPGQLKITSFMLSKLATPSSQILAVITQSGKVGMVKADIKLHWMGVKQKSKDAPGAPGAAAPPALQVEDGMSR